VSIAWFVLVYLAAGIVFLLCYILSMKPDRQNAQLGIIALFWPAILVLDVVLAISTQFGKIGSLLAQRFQRGG